ncbi:arabinogalactan endo-1,4-beta-galactosidase [Prevotella sp. tc2-28]|uniref:glycosyl hydrolase 53 family protein n=1 Tax=Prevotella sp. tc2-28 TaxID=1761888 RepID=UPI0008952DC6|nr:glycosyl hydrolase 53 family protein [Prevotella sp. tc2-28]SEA38598.1 arabinogalactan endo-1,4-beta-galactosidase [Prevotella sp. tc2-28]
MKKTLLLTLCCILSLTITAQKYVGGDISMLKKFIDEGAIYKDYDDQPVEPLTFFKQQGWNAQRVRLFVDPANATDTEKKEGAIQDLEYVKALGKSIKDAGLSLMLDFHYSDTWTHPGQHGTPAAWKNLTADQMATKVYDYTKNCLQEMIKAGATPDFIQVGNEITDGMLFPTGKISNSSESWDILVNLIKEGIKACNEICPQAKTVLHTELHNYDMVKTFYAKMANATVQYDIIGLSYYPDFHNSLTVFNTLLTQLETTYTGKQIMIVETGYGFEYQLAGAKYNFTSTYPLTDTGQQKFTKALIETLNTHERVTGLFWWYPEYNLNGIINKTGTEDWSKDFTSGYWNGALFWPRSGYPLSAIKELKSFLGGYSGIETIRSSSQQDGIWYTLDGRRLNGKPAARGLYIHNGKKIIVK